MTDVVAWAESIFNTGPSTGLPVHVQDAMSMAYDDLQIQVRMGRHTAFVLPVGSRKSGVKQKVDYTVRRIQAAVRTEARVHQGSLLLQTQEPHRATLRRRRRHRPRVS